MEEMKTLTIGGQTYKIVDGDAVHSYYSTAREDLSTTLGMEDAVPNDVTSEVVWGLYDALMAEHPGKVQKNEIHNDNGSFTNYEYVISTGEYNTDGEYAKWYGDADIKKPKYLLLSGIHGLYEMPAILSTYRFVRDVLEGNNVPAQFREGCVIHIMPVGNPYCVDNHIRYNANGVDINRNFDWNWSVNVSGSKPNEGKYPGTSGNSEKETQAIVNWLTANQDAEIFFDCHNNTGAVTEVAWFIGVDGDAFKVDDGENKRLKEIALRGVGRVVPLWRDVIGYHSGTVYPTSWKFNEGGLAIFYASEVLNIPSLALEMSGLQNATQDEFMVEFNAGSQPITPETVSAGAEIIGNVLIEFYEQSFVSEVNEDMKAIDDKLATLLEQVNSGFRVETGVYTVEADVDDGSAIVELPCKGVKILVFVSDANTRTEILATTSGIWIVGFVGQTLAEMPYYSQTFIRCAGYVSRMNGGKLESAAGLLVDTDNGVKTSLVGLKKGTYNWTAYYWNEPETANE